MSFLIYPTLKQSPILGVAGLGGGIGSNLLGSAAGGGTPTGAVHFLEFGGSNASFTDQIGTGTGGTTSLNFTVNTGKMALNDTTYGGPPGYSNAGFQADAVTNLTAMRTAEDVIPDLSGDFTLDVCSYNASAPASGSNMVWCVAKHNHSGYTNYIYNASGSCRFDTSNTTWNNRVGEAGGSTNYTQNKWCVSRLRRSSGTMYVEWYEENSGGNGWDLKSGGFNGSVSGAGPNTNNSVSGVFLINSWDGNSSGYSITNLGVAWIVFYESSYTDTPWVP